MRCDDVIASEGREKVLTTYEKMLTGSDSGLGDYEKIDICRYLLLLTDNIEKASNEHGDNLFELYCKTNPGLSGILETKTTDPQKFQVAKTMMAKELTVFNIYTLMNRVMEIMTGLSNLALDRVGRFKEPLRVPLESMVYFKKLFDCLKVINETKNRSYDFNPSLYSDTVNVNIRMLYEVILLAINKKTKDLSGTKLIPLPMEYYKVLKDLINLNIDGFVKIDSYKSRQLNFLVTDINKTNIIDNKNLIRCLKIFIYINFEFLFLQDKELEYTRRETIKQNLMDSFLDNITNFQGYSNVLEDDRLPSPYAFYRSHFNSDLITLYDTFKYLGHLTPTELLATKFNIYPTPSKELYEVPKTCLFLALQHKLSSTGGYFNLSSV